MRQPKLFHRIPRHLRKTNGSVDEYEVYGDGNSAQSILRETSPSELVKRLEC